jgi:tetratricopeptide (TPR) repeat protein
VREGPLPVGRWIYPIVDVDIRSLAMRYVRAKMPDVAVNLFEGRIRREPKVAAHHNDLGVLFAQMGELEPATKAFAVAVELDPNDVAARRNLEYAQRQLREGPPGGGAAPRGPTPPPRAPD